MIGGGDLALDHLTVVDANPVRLAEIAHATGCRAVCLFLKSMPLLPRMPVFDLHSDRRARADLKSQLDDLGLQLDLAYPYTLADRTAVEALIPALDSAAALGARMINLLVYDREATRRADRFGWLCNLARERGLAVAVEFFPLSQVRTLGEALALTMPIGRPGEVGVNVDILHLMRSGGSIADLAAAPPGSILYAQQCDGPATVDPDRQAIEAAAQRLLAGQGVFDCAGFARALPHECPISVELPQEEAIITGVPALDRAMRAVESVREALSRA